MKPKCVLPLRSPISQDTGLSPAVMRLVTSWTEPPRRCESSLRKAVTLSLAQRLVLSAAFCQPLVLLVHGLGNGVVVRRSGVKDLELHGSDGVFQVLADLFRRLRWLDE